MYMELCFGHLTNNTLYMLIQVAKQIDLEWITIPFTSEFHACQLNVIFSSKAVMLYTSYVKQTPMEMS